MLDIGVKPRRDLILHARFIVEMFSGIGMGMDQDPRRAGGKVFGGVHVPFISHIEGARDQVVLATVMEDHGSFSLREGISDAVDIGWKESIGLLDGVLDVRRHQFESIEQTSLLTLRPLRHFVEDWIDQRASLPASRLPGGRQGIDLSIPAHWAKGGWLWLWYGIAFALGIRRGTFFRNGETRGP